MRKSYDFSEAKKNPYASRLKKQITIRIDASTIDYFTALSEETGIPYQTMINLYLRECAATKKKLSLSWEPTTGLLRSITRRPRILSEEPAAKKPAARPMKKQLVSQTGAR